MGTEKEVAPEVKALQDGIAAASSVNEDYEPAPAPDPPEPEGEPEGGGESAEPAVSKDGEPSADELKDGEAAAKKEEGEGEGDPEGGDPDPAAAGQGEPDETDKEITSLGIKNEKAAARFRELTATAKRLPELEARVREADELIQSFENVGAAPQQVGAMMGYLNAINRGGPKEWEQAEQALSKELEWLRGKLGKPVGADPLAAHADLKAEVEEGLMTPQRAAEIVELRGRQKAYQDYDGQRQQATQAERAVDMGRSRLNELEATLSVADPNYAAKREHLVAVLKPVIQNLPPDKWAQAFEQAYRTLPANFGAPVQLQQQVRQRPTAGAVPLRSAGSGGGGGLAKEATSPEEALRMGLEAAARGQTY